jgi:hypothetical protein
MPTRVVGGLIAAALFVGAMLLATSREASVECDVCMDFGGGSRCSTSSARDRNSALRGAVANACAVLSNGVTQGMECDRTPPRSVRCSE